MSVYRAVLRIGSLKLCAPGSLIKILDLPAAACHCRCKSAVSTSIPRIRHYSSKSDSVVKQSDNDDQERELIYTGQLISNIRKIKVFTLFTSSLGICVQPLVYFRAMEAGSISAMTIPFFALVGIFAVGTPLLIHSVTRRYVLDVEYLPKEDKYIATTYSLFVKKKKIEFTPNDVTIPTVLGIFCTCAIKGRKLFLDSQCFTNQDHFVRIMGYDKPIDLDPNVNTGEPEPKKESN